MHVLVVEDDERVASHVVKGLKGEGWLVDHVADGRQALFQVAAETYDVIVLDRMLPNVDGLKILQTMRASGDSTPVLILSALGDVDNRVKGLRAGGDDYLAKPFAFSELLARVEALSRRKAVVQETTALNLADLEMNLLTRTVTRRGRAIDLTTREFSLLEYLLRNAGRVVSRSMLLEAVWDYNFDPQTNIIDQHVSRLRQKIDKDFDPPLVQTIRGMGYSLRA
ncbi:MAG: response regulator transcription factor [Alphaproteobacteria bacterium]|nr:response regulator transcription factor [Alphaproteobacteria bacterium]MBU1513510.1 response regulator transcription factor [Alphaproteobacteria bacterium]MBU2096618.1 response regulator transcription factor [Alphaproteobacteria bacterium]MBU2150596.1 response regulator transcription factor [Alphaproteobacteria bacterium]MBU2306569.1 response regulator transcription factor [Alphaproteobacteria bacterium]